MFKAIYRIGLLLVCGVIFTTQAQDGYPNRALTLTVPFPPGGFVDLSARPLAMAMEKILKHPVIISNRGGAGGTVGTVLAANAKADGYNVLMTASTISLMPEADKLFNRKPAYTLDQFQPIALIWTDAPYLVVQNDSEWTNIKSLINDAKSHPGERTYSSSGIYGGLHVPIEMFLQSQSIKMRHVPTNGGGPAITALLGGHVQLSAGSPASLSAHVKSAKLRALAGWGAKRNEWLPEVPTFMELGYRLEYYLWVGVFVPKATEEAVSHTLRQTLREVVQNETFKSSMVKLHTPIHYMDAPEFRVFWDQDVKTLSTVMKGIGKVEEKN